MGCYSARFDLSTLLLPDNRIHQCESESNSRHHLGKQAELMFRVCQATRYFLIGGVLRRLEYQLEWVLLVSNQGQGSHELPALYSGAADRKQCAADLHALLLTLPADCSDQQGTRLHLR